MSPLRRRPRRLLTVGLLVAALASLAGSCGEDAQERLRRLVEGGVTFETEPDVLARIAALEADLTGTGVSLAARMAALQVPGASIAVVNGGAVEWVEAYGVRAALTGEPMRRYTRLQGGSLSKPTTAVAILQLVEQGLLDLDAPVNDSLTSWQIPDNAFTTSGQVTLRQILSHTGGISVPSFIGYNAAAGAELPTLLQVLDGLDPAINEPVRVIRVPGTSWLYSGGAYTILQQLLQDVTGGAFPAWVRSHVFTPQFMWRSHFDQPLPADQQADAAVGNVPGIPIPLTFAYPELPAAGLWSTALDVARFVVAMQGALAGAPDAPLGAATAAALFTPQTPAPVPGQLVGSSPQMGLGFFLVNGPNPGWFWHTGSNVGFTCILVGDLQGAGYGAVVMTNNFPGGTTLGWEVVNAVADLYGWPGWGNWSF